MFKYCLMSCSKRSGYSWLGNKTLSLITGVHSSHCHSSSAVQIHKYFDAKPGQKFCLQVNLGHTLDMQYFPVIQCNRMCLPLVATVHLVQDFQVFIALPALLFAAVCLPLQFVKLTRTLWKAYASQYCKFLFREKCINMK